MNITQAVYVSTEVETFDKEEKEVHIFSFRHEGYIVTAKVSVKIRVPIVKLTEGGLFHLRVEEYVSEDGEKFPFFKALTFGVKAEAATKKKQPARKF
jgi:hypothetical protein